MALRLTRSINLSSGLSSRSTPRQTQIYKYTAQKCKYSSSSPSSSSSSSPSSNKIQNNVTSRTLVGKSAQPARRTRPTTAAFEKSTPVRTPFLHPVPKSKASMDESFVGKSGGQIFHDMMLRQDVKYIFGYPGGAILPVFDAIYNSPHFSFILPRHEQGAGHMAQGYARASGKPGVVLVTSGPGATNVITPMQDAYSDGTPLVVFCGQVPTSAIGTDAFQEADVIGISRSCTKWNVMVKDIAELPRRINEAFEIATSGRPGPVLVDLPKDVTASILRNPIPVRSALPISAASTIKAPIHKLEQIAKLIEVAERPVIYAGQGVLGDEDGPAVLKELAEKGNIPVTTTLQGLGAFDEYDPKSLHMLGMHGSAYANLAMQNADLIIALGARFDDRVTGALPAFAPKAKAAAAKKAGGIVHFEIMPKNINKIVEATHAIEGDVTENVKELIPLLNKVTKESRDLWLAEIAQWKERMPFDYEPSDPGERPKPQTVLQELDKQCKAIKDKVIITTGVGQHQMQVAQFYRWTAPRSMITSGGLGTMGYGLPSAIGAQCAKPDCIVVDVDGDSSFCMTAMELMTAAEYNIKVKVLILNNEEQGMVTQWQTLFYENRYAHSSHKHPDFVKLSEAMGVKGITIRTVEEVESKMKEFLEYNDGPVLLNALVAPKEQVLPMVPAGKALDEFIMFDKEKAKELKAKGMPA